MTGLFKDTTFLVIETQDDEEYTSTWIQDIIKRNLGSAVLLSPEISDQAIQKHSISHIITSTYKFNGYSRAQDLMLPVTTAQWLEDSELASQRKNYRLYSPHPVPFMDKVVVCVADNLPPGDKEMMYAGVRAFGGQYLDSLSRYTTHLVAVDLSNIKSVLVANIKKREDLKIQIVLPHWLDDCFKQQKRLDEAPYRLSDPVALRTGKPNFEAKTSAYETLLGDENYDENTPSQANEALLGKRVYLASDYCLSEHLKESIHEMIQLCGGEVVEQFDVDNLDVYIGQYREGSEYDACLRSSEIEVASLRWLYQVARRREYLLPLKSNALNFPLPRGHIPEFSGLRISITGYSGDARHYLSLLITIMGALFTKTLDCNNNYLVAEKHGGEKYMAVKSRWPEVKIVNHLWIEHCFAKWRFVDHLESIYQQVLPSTPRLGTTVIDVSLLKGKASRQDLSLNVDDSATEDFELNISSHPNNDNQEGTSPSSDDQIPANIEQKKDELPEAQEKEKFSSRDKENEGVELDHDYLVIQVNEASSPVTSRGRRSAKEKAAKKLHDDMENLNKYASILKSSRKMKSYMEELESSSNKAKEASAQKQPAEEEVAKTPAAKKRKILDEDSIWQVVIMTGCEKLLILNRADVVKLSKVGIKVVNDYKANRKIDTIVAPRVLRTEKFLKCLSQCEQVLHPKYLVEILEEIKKNPQLSLTDIRADFAMNLYSLDSVLSVKKVNNELGVASKENGLKLLLEAPNKGSVFKELKLNLSHNLNGGPDLIASILKEHGLEEVKFIKLTGTFDPKKCLANFDGKVIVIAHKDKDSKVADDVSSDNVVVVDWDWCVKSIFQLKLVDFEDFKCGKHKSSTLS